MSRRNKKKRKVIESCEHQSDRRTAEYVARRLDEIQDDLFDLIADLRTFEHYSQIEDVGWSLRLLQRIKRSYRRFAEHGVWETGDG